MHRVVVTGMAGITSLGDTWPAIEAATEVWIVVAGKDKAEAVHKFFASEGIPYEVKA